MTSAAPEKITAIHAVTGMIPDSWTLGLIFLLVGFAALVAVMFYYENPGWLSFLLLGPQQLFLVLSAMGALTAIKTSSFADGVVRPWQFIAADQSGYILVAILHTIAVVEIHVRPIWNHSQYS